MRLQMIGVICLVICLSGCGPHVSHRYGFMGPDTWEISKNGESVPIYAGDCPEPRALAYEIAKEVKAGSVDWDWMVVDRKYERIVIRNACEKITKQGRKE